MSAGRGWLGGWPPWLCALALAGGCAPAPADASHDPGPIGLNSSLPILWNEAGGVAAHLSPWEPHWALAVLAKKGDVQGIDSLAGPEGVASLGPTGLLVLAQPYPLSPDENVALDDWVRGGGRVLLFADPMLTVHSIYPLGDRRRPQDVALLSPILTRWGLALHFDEVQPAARRYGKFGDITMPMQLSGSFTALSAGSCTIEDQGLIASCAVGKGRILAVADAALLERDAGTASESQSRALTWLLDRLSR